MSANDHQVGGTHYKQDGGEQHWDRIWRLYGRGYFVGCITKYVERYHLKNGPEDLRKAQHFLDKLIELEGAQSKPKPKPDPVQQEADDDFNQRLYDAARNGTPPQEIEAARKAYAAKRAYLKGLR